MRLRGRSLELPVVGGMEDPLEGAALGAELFWDTESKAVEVAFCAQSAIQTSSCWRKERASLKRMGGLDAEIVGAQWASLSLRPLRRQITIS